MSKWRGGTDKGRRTPDRQTAVGGGKKGRADGEERTQEEQSGRRRRGGAGAPTKIHTWVPDDQRARELGKKCGGRDAEQRGSEGIGTNTKEKEGSRA